MLYIYNHLKNKTHKWPSRQDMRHADICDMETEGWSGRPGAGLWPAAANHERKWGSKERGVEQLPWLEISQRSGCQREAWRYNLCQWVEDRKPTEPCMSGKFYHTGCTSLAWKVEAPDWQHLSWVIWTQSLHLCCEIYPDWMTRSALTLSELCVCRLLESLPFAYR